MRGDALEFLVQSGKGVSKEFRQRERRRRGYSREGSLALGMVPFTTGYGHRRDGKSWLLSSRHDDGKIICM